MRRLDDQIKRFRRFQPSLITLSMFQVDLKPFGLGSVVDAARTLDFCLGARRPGERPDKGEHAAIWSEVFRRGRDLCYRSILRRKPPGALTGRID